MRFIPRPRQLLALFLVIPGLVLAQQSSDSQGIVTESVVVRGILPENLESLPGSSAVLTDEAIEERKPFSVIETMREVPGIHVVPEDAFGTHLNIGLRGLNPRRSSRTLLMEDGAPTIFFAPYGDPSAHYSTPLDRVERIEFLKGSGQILYGPQTMGGMINFVTRPVPDDGVAGNVKLEGGNNSYRGAYANFGTGGEWGGVMLDVLKKQGDGTRSNHEFDIQEATLKGLFNLSDTQRLIAKGSFFEEDSLISETGLTAAEYAIDPYSTPGNPAENYRMYRRTGQLIHELDLSDQAKLSTQMYYTNVWRQSKRAREFELENNETALEDDEFAIRPRMYQTYGIEPKLELMHNLFGLQSDAVFGVRYHEEEIDRNKYELDGSLQGAPIFDERLTIDVKALAYYAQNTFYAGDWTFTPGLRVEDVEYDKVLWETDPNTPVDTQTSSETTVLPGFGLTWNGLRDTTLFAGIHKGFAPPRPDRDVDEGQIFETSPEISVTTEVGVRTRAFKGVNMEATFFNMDIRDLVVQVNDVFRNAGEAQHTGFEIGSRIDFGTIFDRSDNVFVTLSYTNLFKAEFKNSGVLGGEGEDGYGTYAKGNRLPYAPKHLLSASLGYEHPTGFTARLGMNYVSEQFANTENFRNETDCPAGVTCTDAGLFGTVPAVTLFNASINYAPRGSKASYFVFAENLFDKKYFNARTNGIQTGRPLQVVGGVNYAF
ncbi:MAG TPA: TonB-dependent receptor [Burkholderiales bacterium]|nr:TonB-dependent receptor [Burkholderiales bacterium]